MNGRVQLLLVHTISEIAYNVNLNTTSVRRANAIAFDVREAGRVVREGDPVTGKIVNDENGEPLRIPGTLKKVRAIGWFIRQYGVAQISMEPYRYFRKTDAPGF